MWLETKNVLFAAHLVCNPPSLVNYTSEPFNSVDYEHLESAKKGCKRIYKESPCVKEFRKRTTERDYSVICTKERVGK